MFTRVLVGLVLTLCSSALAFGSYRDQAFKQLKLGPDKASGGQAMGCTYCHLSPDGGAPWNPFGELLQSKLEGDFGKALYAALAANKDSDGDGFADVLEVFAKTLPGDAKSLPGVSLEALKTQFEQGGGLEQYRP